MPVHFITGSEVTTIRMTSGSVGDCMRAAATLGCRFFIRREGFHKEGNCPIWGVYDTAKPMWKLGETVHKSVRVPRREFICESLDAPIMYAMAMRGIE